MEQARNATIPPTSTMVIVENLHVHIQSCNVIEEVLENITGSYMYM